MSDLRGFIDLVRRERPQDVVDVHRAVTPAYETAAVVTKLEQSARFPIVLFHDVRNSKYPVVSNVCATHGRLALALGCSARDLRTRYADACEHPLKPEPKKVGPVQEQVFTGKEVDLKTLPQLLYHEDDAREGYITAAIIVARDPDTGKSNLSFHRLMIRGRNTTTVFMARGKHLDIIYRKYERASKAMPAAAFIGVHPACSLGALYTGASDVEEYDIVGGLLRSPFQVVQCLTNQLQVPAQAEFVLEGEVSAASRTDEGPFGEFTGFSTGKSRCPIFNVHALTCRQNPIFQDIVSGSMEHLLLPLIGMEHHLLAVARSVVPETTAVRVAAPLSVFVAVNKTEDSQPQRIIDALFACDIYVKYVVVVDSDVDISDLRNVAAAIALHTRPGRDIIVKEGFLGTELDPSGSGSMTKVGINATLPLEARICVKKNRIPQKVLDSISIAELLGQQR